MRVRELERRLEIEEKATPKPCKNEVVEDGALNGGVTTRQDVAILVGPGCMRFATVIVGGPCPMLLPCVPTVRRILYEDVQDLRVLMRESALVSIHDFGVCV